MYTAPLFSRLPGEQRPSQRGGREAVPAICEGSCHPARRPRESLCITRTCTPDMPRSTSRGKGRVRSGGISSSGQFNGLGWGPPYAFSASAVASGTPMPPGEEGGTRNRHRFAATRNRAGAVGCGGGRRHRHIVNELLIRTLTLRPIGSNFEGAAR